MLNRPWLRETIAVDGITYTRQLFQSDEVPEFAHKSVFHYDTYRLIKAWYSDAPTIDVFTSGSTSNSPKTFQATRPMMVNSVQYTRDFFGLKQGDVALLSLPLGYIAGTMMVVRALVIGMDLKIAACRSRPLEEMCSSEAPRIAFASMTALQVYNSLKYEADSAKLAAIKNLIVVGGPVNAKTEQILKKFPNNIYSTYGMAETLSHIALRRISGEFASDRYTPLNEVSVGLDAEGALIIDAPRVTAETIYTKDLAEIFPDGSFKLLGRTDNVINTGGVKVSSEYIESLIQPVIDGIFAISSVPDAKFGQAIVLVTEKDVDIKLINQKLPPYYRPKKVLRLDKIPLTKTEKINRGLIRELLQGLTLQSDNDKNLTQSELYRK